MKRAATLFVVLAVLAPAIFGAEAVSGGEAILIKIDGTIGPATSAYVTEAIQDSETQGAKLLIIQMDTPGGLDTSMRSIIKGILASTVPVVGYVAPSGARAASAGTYILYACQVAAMAPGTNVGAATPVQIGGLFGGKSPEKAGSDKKGKEGGAAEGSGDAMTHKLVNDAVAYIRGLAELRGRNAEWAEQAVRNAASIPAAEALKLGVIDLIASDRDELLEKLDGRVVKVAGRDVTLGTRDLHVAEVAPDWQSRILSFISNPNVAYVLMLVGIYGLIYEFSNPGTVLPGTVGVVSLVLALYAFQLLPVNYAGMALMLLGLALMVAEAFMPSFGALGVGGVAAFVVGSLMLIDTRAPGFGLSVSLILSFAVVSAVLVFFVISMALRSHGRPVVSGSEELVGATGHALSTFSGEGSVRLHGEVWSARSQVPVATGEEVEVVGRDGLVLLVKHRKKAKEA
jgi:membrane-bound serine protease (ClpP class)